MVQVVGNQHIHIYIQLGHLKECSRFSSDNSRIIQFNLKIIRNIQCALLFLGDQLCQRGVGVGHFKSCFCLHHQGLMLQLSYLHAIFIHKAFICTSPDHMGNGGQRRALCINTACKHDTNHMNPWWQSQRQSVKSWILSSHWHRWLHCILPPWKLPVIWTRNITYCMFKVIWHPHGKLQLVTTNAKSLADFISDFLQTLQSDVNIFHAAGYN